MLREALLVWRNDNAGEKLVCLKCKKQTSVILGKDRETLFCKYCSRSDDLVSVRQLILLYVEEKKKEGKMSYPLNSLDLPENVKNGLGNWNVRK